MAPFAPAIDQRVAADGRECANRAVDAARQDLLRAGEQPGRVRPTQLSSWACASKALRRRDWRMTSREMLHDRPHEAGNRVLVRHDRRPDPALLRRLRGHRPDRRDGHRLQEVGDRIDAVQPHEVPHRRGAREGDDVDLAIEQHPVDVGLVVALDFDRHRPVGDHLGDESRPPSAVRPRGTRAPCRRAAAGTSCPARSPAVRIAVDHRLGGVLRRNHVRPAGSAAPRRSAVPGPIAHSLTPASDRVSVGPSCIRWKK